MLNKKLIIGFIAALIALIVIGFAALNFVLVIDLVFIYCLLFFVLKIFYYPLLRSIY